MRTYVHRDRDLDLQSYPKHAIGPRLVDQDSRVTLDHTSSLSIGLSRPIDLPDFYGYGVMLGCL